MNKRGIVLDADRMGELLVVLADYRTHINMELTDIMGDEELLMEAMDTCYYIGVIEAHVQANNLSKDELELLEAWEKELYEESKEDEVSITAQFMCALDGGEVSTVIDEVAEFITNSGFHIEFIGTTPDNK